MKKTYFSLFELMVMVSCGILLTVLKISLKLPLKMPGHSGLYWMALLIIAYGLVNKRGAAVLTGVFSACIAILMVPGKNGPLDTFISYCAAGLGVEIGMLLLGKMRNVYALGLIGLIGNGTKLIVKMASDLLIGMPLSVVIISRTYAFLTYAAFGITGGVLAYLILGALEKAGLFAYLQERM